MNLLDIRTTIQNNLQDSGIYRSDAHVTTGINDGYLLVCLASMCDERQGTVYVDGTRNFNTLPVSGDAYCFAPIAVIDAVSGYRLAPARVDQFDFYNAAWEGIVDSGCLYYTMLSQFETSRTVLLTCPIQTLGRTHLTVYGAYIPDELSADTDEPRFEAGYHDVLVHYGLFYGYLGEPGYGQQAQQEYVVFVSRLNELIASVKARFPSGRDFEPWPIEFGYAGVTVQEQTSQPQEQKSESQ